MYVGRWRHLRLRFVACFVVEAPSVDNKGIVVLRICGVDYARLGCTRPTFGKSSDDRSKVY